MDKALLLIISILLISSVIRAQEENIEPSLETGTLENRFEYVQENSNNYKGYEVVKSGWLEQLKQQVVDSLQEQHKILEETRKQVAARQNKIESLTTGLQEMQDSINNLNVEKANIGFFGWQLQKDYYKHVMGIIIAGLLALLAFFIFQFWRSNAITAKTQETLSEIRAEYETHKTLAREKEQKLKRELQDELNKRL